MQKQHRKRINGLDFMREMVKTRKSSIRTGENSLEASLGRALSGSNMPEASF